MVKDGMRTRLPLLALSAGFLIASSSTFAAAQSSMLPGPEARSKWPSYSTRQPPVQSRICSCLYGGENIPIGQTICMKFEGRKVMATCGTVVNNPSWSISKKLCPSA